MINPTSYSREYHIAETPWYDESLKSKANVFHVGAFWLLVKRFGFIPIINCKETWLCSLTLPNGRNWMSLIDINDCCSLALHLSNQSKIVKIANLYNPNLIVKQMEFVEIISEVLNIPMKKISLRKYLGIMRFLRQ